MVSCKRLILIYYVVDLRTFVYLTKKEKLSHNCRSYWWNIIFETSLQCVIIVLIFNFKHILLDVFVITEDWSLLILLPSNIMTGFTPPGQRDGLVSTLIYGLVSFYFSPLVAMMTMGPWALLCNIICSIYEVFYHVRANTMSPNQIEMYGQYNTHIVRINSHFMPMGSILFSYCKVPFINCH